MKKGVLPGISEKIDEVSLSLEDFMGALWCIDEPEKIAVNGYDDSGLQNLLVLQPQKCI